MLISNYKNCGDDYRNVSISGDRGKKANYVGKCYSDLAPKKDFWQQWHDNIGKISEEENTRYYIEEYYKQVLSKLDPDKVYYDLKDRILLCYEDPEEFCHRHIVAEWIKLLFDEDVPEVKAENYKYQRVDNSYSVGTILEEVIRQNIPNMKGFTSLMALRLFEKGEKFEVDGYGMLAAGLRCQADDAEDEYKRRKQSNIRKLFKNSSF